MNIAAFIWGVGTAITFLAGVIQAIAAWRDLRAYSAQTGRHQLMLVGSSIFFIVLAVAFGYAAYSSYSATPTNRTTSTPTTASNSTPTNRATSTPTTASNPTPTLSATQTPTGFQSPTPAQPVPTSTPSPTLSSQKTLHESIRLKCDCSDPVIATITQIVIQPQQNKMLWSMTFSTSQQGAYAAFANGNFYLQEGDQINDPAPEKQKYDATGSVIGTFNGIALQAGKPQQVIITFFFVPYTAMPYTLVSIMQMDCCGQKIAHFHLVPFTF